jgi:hypothetical protein
MCSGFHLRMAGVEHPHLVAVLAQDRRKGLNPQRRKGHHLDPPMVDFDRSSSLGSSRQKLSSPT